MWTGQLMKTYSVKHKRGIFYPAVNIRFTCHHWMPNQSTPSHGDQSLSQSYPEDLGLELLAARNTHMLLTCQHSAGVENDMEKCRKWIANVSLTNTKLQLNNNLNVRKIFAVSIKQSTPDLNNEVENLTINKHHTINSTSCHDNRLIIPRCHASYNHSIN